MWELVATAAAGINAGAGLQAAVAGGPTADSAVFARFAGRSRLINLLLTTTCTAAAAASYYTEERGSLWLYASVATALGIPFNLLLMAPPTASWELADAARLQEEEPFAVKTLEAERTRNDSVTCAEGNHSVASIQNKLMYAKSGVLVSPAAYASSWTRKFWFSACLSCLSCGVMLALVATHKDAATYTNTPF